MTLSADEPSNGGADLPGGVVTFLLTDIERSTASWEADHEAMGVAVERHERLIADTVGAAGGIVVKDRGGGDSTVSVFTRASNAAEAAIALQQALRAEAWPKTVELRVRSCLHTGEAGLRGDRYGRLLHRAVRIRDLADGGQVLCSRATSELILDDLPRGVRLVELGSSQPTYAGRVERVFTLEHPDLHQRATPADGTPDRPPLPSAVRSADGQPLVGRAHERSLLEAAWEESRAGRLGVVLLGGEPGIGKSRLASEIALVADRTGGTVLYGRCDEELGIAYQPFVEAIRHYLAHGPADVLKAHVERYGGELARIAPELARRLGDVPPARSADPETERLRLFGAVVDLLGLASAATPILLFLDDLHWATAPTLLLLRHLVQTNEPMAVLVVGTFRDTEVGSTDLLGALLADWRQLPTVQRVRLAGLDETDVRALLGSAPESRDAAAEVVTAVCRQTGGNPLFVRELATHWAEIGDASGGQLGLPEGVRDVVARRVARLSDDANAVLPVAAVTGDEFELDVLETIIDLDVDHLLDALDESVRAGIVSEVAGLPGRYRFTHSLVRQTLYEDLMRVRRVRLHRRIGEAMEALHGSETEAVLHALAYHFSEAASDGQAGKAADYRLRASRQALKRLAYEQAISETDAGLEVLDRHPSGGSDELRYELLFTKGIAQRGISGIAFRESLYAAIEVARRMGEPVRSARAVAATARTGTFSSVGEVDEQMVRLYRQTIEDLGDADLAMRALLLGRLAVETVFSASWEERGELCKEALALARQHAEPSDLADVILASIQAQYDPTNTAQRLDLAREMLSLSELTGSEFELLAHMNCSAALLEMGDVAASLAHAHTSQRLAEEIGRPLLRWQAEAATAWQSMLAGPEIAEARATELFALNSEDRSAFTAFAAHLFQARWDQGRLAELVGLLVERVAEMPLAPAWRAGLGVALAEDGHLDEAREQFEWFAAREFVLPRDYTWWATMVNVCEVCVALRDRERARALLEVVAPVAHQVTVMGVGMTSYGAGDRQRASLEALLGEYDEAESHFESALELNERLAAHTALVRTRRAFAEMLTERALPGDTDRAQTLARVAHRTAQELGMTRERERLESLLASDQA